MGNHYPHLLSPFKVGKVPVKNRFVLAPMGLGFKGYDGKGNITQEGIDYYCRFAKGGFGLLCSGSLATDTDVDKNVGANRWVPNWNPKLFNNSATQLTERVHAYGAKMFAQISVGVGRNGTFKSSSPNPFYFRPDVIAEELTADEIERKVELEVQAALLCKKAGFDGVDIHAMHWGYLLDQFAMSITNRREDEYGGCLENRLRMARMIVEGIKQTCGADFPVSMRMGLKSYMTGLGPGQGSLTGENEAGRTIEEAVEICKRLEAYGYDMLNCDVGTYESFYHGCPPMYIPKCNYVDLAAQVKEAVGIPVVLANRMDDADLCEKAIAEGKIDAVAMARGALADPAYPQKVAMGRVEDIRPCIACCQCIDVCTKTGDFAGCTVNPSVSRDLSYGIVKTTAPRKVAVIGGGVAGMEAALVAKKSGHDVVLFEASGELGGNLLPASVHGFKKDVRKLNDWMKRELVRAQVDVRLNTRATADMVRQMGAEVVLVANGSTPVMPRIPGIDHPKCVSCLDVLNGKRQPGEHVVIVGGGLVGCEMAIEYAMEGKRVSIVEALGAVMSSGPEVPMPQEMMVRELLKKYDVEQLTGHKIVAVNDCGAEIESVEDGTKSVVAADTVVMAVGFRSAPSMTEEFYGAGLEVYTIGDANRVGSVKTSIWDAYEVARML